MIFVTRKHRRTHTQINTHFRAHLELAERMLIDMAVTDLNSCQFSRFSLTYGPSNRQALFLQFVQFSPRP